MEIVEAILLAIPPKFATEVYLDIENNCFRSAYFDGSKGNETKENCRMKRLNIKLTLFIATKSKKTLSLFNGNVEGITESLISHVKIIKGICKDNKDALLHKDSENEFIKELSYVKLKDLHDYKITFIQMPGDTNHGYYNVDIYELLKRYERADNDMLFPGGRL